MVAIDPVQDVERAIGAQCKQVVAGDRLRLACLGHHEELGKDGDGLEVDGEGPEDFHRGERLVEDQGKDGHGAEEELNSKAVMVAVISGSELHVHQVDGSCGRNNEKHLRFQNGHHEIKMKQRTFMTVL